MCGGAWGGCLVLAGLWAIRHALSTEPTGALALCLGMAGVFAGNFIFMEIVADRLVSPRPRRAADLIESLSATAMIVSLVASAVIWFQSVVP